MIKAIQKVEDPAKKVYLTTTFFGNAGVNMVHLANQVADGLAKLKEEANRTGNVLGNDFFSDAENFDNSIKGMRENIGGLGKTIGSKLIPVITPIINKISEWIMANQELIKGKITGSKKRFFFFYGWNKFYDYKLKFNTPEERKEFGVTKEEQELAKVYKLSAEQINWRRKKLIDFKGRERLFNQEYPICWQDAFVSSIQNTLIDSLHIYKAAENEISVNDNQPIIVGIDPARDGGDRTVITVRQARKIINIFVLLDKTAPELEAILIIR